MDIAFFERKYTDFELDKSKIRFSESIISNEINFCNTWEELQKKIPEILFYHGSDIHLLKDKHEFGEKWKSELMDIWLIEYGAYPTHFYPVINNILRYINFNDLQGRISKIKNALGQLNYVTVEMLINIVFGFDNKLEELLIPFATANPFEASNEENETLQEAKVSLQAYVAKLIENLSKER